MDAFETSGIILKHTTSVSGYQNIIDNYIHLRINNVLISSFVLINRDKVFQQNK